MQNQSQESSNGSKLTQLQQQRYDLLFPTYGPIARDIVTNVYGKGKCSWPSFLERMDAVIEAKPHVKEYYESLYETFQLNGVYAPGQIIGNVSEVRRQLDLPQYTEKIKIQSEHDFNLLFLIEDVYQRGSVEGVDRMELVGYRPLVRIMPDYQS